ncbi:hypothetical protein ATY77_10560 [Rhizobium sp. R634]|uniref:hypothetical protein n=1 Tax=Rhizobium sp. R634 TaxID=1764274 RepID=UPI000B5381FB|nr:hypothetical protein [Rhizobium sp. R634]OWV71969.1 hypothetical protein ATY77_10560 [Rhizobium sp. R634]
MLRVVGWLILLSAISGIFLEALKISLGEERYGGPFYVGHYTGSAVGIALALFLFGLIIALAVRYLFKSKKARGTYSGLASGIVGVVLFTAASVTGIIY